MDWPWLVKQSAGFLIPKIDAEDLAEIEGMVEGLRQAGCASSREELAAYNGMIELFDYWWPGELKRIKEAPTATTAVRQSCSSFIATGKRHLAEGH